MPKVPAAHLEARRRGILKAAFRCFVRNGLHTTTVRDICRAANLSPGAVYRYFPSKQAIIEALAEESRDRLREFFGSIDAASADGIGELLRPLVRALDQPAALDRMRLDIALWAEALREPALRSALSRSGTALSSSLAAPLLPPDAGAGERVALGRALLALFDGLALQKALDPELDLEPALRALAGPSKRRR